MVDMESQPRSFPKARLVVAALLFVGWVSYLGYLVWRTQDLVVVSRSQAIMAHLVLVGDVGAEQEGRPAAVAVKSVLWARATADRQLVGKEILVDWPDAIRGYDGPGEYLLLLNHSGSGDRFHVTPLPAVPGFAGGETRIYRATEDALSQVREVLPE
jgi:hypothetical protein